MDWQRTMQGHTQANIVPVISQPIVMLEEVTPSEENGADRVPVLTSTVPPLTVKTGAILERAERQEEAVLLATYVT